MEIQPAPQTTPCPFCVAPVPAGSSQCSSCGATLSPAGWGTTPRFSCAQPVWHFVLLSLVSFGLYPVYWYYKSWRAVGDFTGKSLRPGWRTVGLFVPILGVVFVYDLLDDVRQMLVAKGLRPTIPAGWLLVMLIGFGLCWRLPDPAWLLGLLTLVPLAITQFDMNRLWSACLPDRPIRSRLSTGEIVLVALGGVLVLLMIWSFAPV